MKPLKYLASALIFCHVTLSSFSVFGAIQKNLQNVLDELQQYKQDQAKAGIQDVELAFAMRKALLLAELLINEDGSLNLELAKSVKPYFISEQPERYEKTIGAILDQLEDTYWITYFGKLQKSSNPDNVANLVIRALFNLSPDDEITDRHAKVAALSAMFAPYNQGPVGDCFAVAGMIRDHEEYYRHSSLDYACVLSYGYLTRCVKLGSFDNFFFLPFVADDDLANTLTLSPNTNISQMPGIAAAIKVMGGKDTQALNQSLLDHFLNNSASMEGVSVQAIIESLAALIAKDAGSDPNLLANQGKYAFSSLTNNPILRACEAAFAAMAEDLPKDSTRSNINDSVESALSHFWKTLPHCENYHKAFNAVLNNSYRLVYNESIPLPKKAEDGSSTDGGFQLYLRDENHPEDIGVQVVTPHDFQHLILHAANEAGTISHQEALAEKVSAYVKNEIFLRDVLWAYDSENVKEKDPVKNYQALARTPMQSCDGDNPYEVDEIDTGCDFDAYVHTYTPSNAKDLLKWALNLSKKIPASELYPMNSPQHAFNYDPTNSDIVSFVKSNMNADNFIRQKIIVPGVQVSIARLEENSQDALADYFEEIVSDQSSSKKAVYKKMVSNLKRMSLSVQKYAQLFLKGLLGILEVTDPFEQNQLALTLDTALLQVLPNGAKDILQKSTIKFAFTNWNDGTKDIYFCGYYNPRTQLVSFGSIDEDNSNLQPMDENEWVNHQNWDVAIIPSNSLQKAL